MIVRSLLKITIKTLRLNILIIEQIKPFSSFENDSFKENLKLI